MPHEMPQDWNVMMSAGPLILLSLVVFYAVSYFLFRGLQASDGAVSPVVGVPVMGTLIFICCPLIMLSLLSLCGGVHFAVVEARMSRDGRLTDSGVVRDRQVRATFGESGVAYQRHWLLIEFADQDGVLHEVEREVDEVSWDRYAPGSRLDIEHLRGKPASWRFASESGLWARLLFRGCWMAAVVAILRCFGACLLRRSCQTHHPTAL
jgi:hypothetical protein